MLMEKAIAELVDIAKSQRIDAMRFDHGNDSAGMRLRWAMQDIRRKAKEIRFDIQKQRRGRKRDKKQKRKQFRT